MSGTTGNMLFSARRMNKSFPGIQAVCDVDFDLRQGEVHALIGENGAGKSTLARIIAGVERPDSGRMLLFDLPYKPAGRAGAERRGVRMVMQELNLISNMTVAENIFIEKLPARFGIINYEKLNRSARELMDRVGLADIEPSVLVKSLGIGQRQMVEIAAGLSRRCRILALDEPTASLSGRETELLFARIEKLKAEGVGIIYISHRIEEVIRIADRVTVLRDGKVVGEAAAGDLSTERIIRLMVGRDLEHREHRGGAHSGRPGLRVVGLNRGEKVRDVSFEVCCGEILGVAGLMGSGRTETMRAVFGADRRDSGEIYLGGSTRPAAIRSPRQAVRKGIAFLTEDRKGQGLLGDMDVRANISLTRLRNVSRWGWINSSAEESVAASYVKALGVRCRSTEQIVASLSGGNQQKVVIAKWLYRDSDVFIFDEPTRGIDVGAKFEIYQMLADLAGKDKAIIFVSSDLKELMAVCDRIMVLSAGAVAGTFAREQWSEEKIMTAALGRYGSKVSRT